MPEPDRRWIIEYVKLQLSADRRVTEALQDALDQVDASMGKVAGKEGVGARARASQLLASRSVINKILHELFKVVGGVVREEQSQAAQLAEELLMKDEKKIWEILEPDASRREDAKRDLMVQAARQIQATMKRIFETEQTLSQRIYRSEALSKGQVSKTINRHIAIGSSADDMAKDLKSLIDPKAPGGVSYRAKLLARTEINNAFHAQSIADAQDRPWINQVQWNLSKSHNEQGCICEEYARQRLFPVSHVPKKPHPQCLCSITPKLPDLDTALKEFMSGQYAPWLP